MRKVYVLGLAALAGVIIGFAWAEEITLTTYYPAPYGVYKEFTTTSKTCLATNPTGSDADANVGIGTTAPGARLQISENSLINLMPRALYAQAPNTGTTNTAAFVNSQATGGTGGIGLAGIGLGGMEEGGTIFGNIQAAIFYSGSGGGLPSDRLNLILNGKGGNVGIGTTTPNRALVVMNNNATMHPAVFMDGNDPLVTDDNYGVGLGAYTGDTFGSIQANTFDNSGRSLLAGGTNLVLNRSGGNVGIGMTMPTAKLHVSGSIKYLGFCSPADYVFEPKYQLESIEEHAQFMWGNKHLPAIPQAEKNEDGKYERDIDADQTGLLEELEKAHVYIQQLNERVKVLEARLAEQRN